MLDVGRERIVLTLSAFQAGAQTGLPPRERGHISVKEAAMVSCDVGGVFMTTGGKGVVSRR